MKVITAFFVLILGYSSMAQNDFEEAIALHNRREYDKAASTFLKIAEKNPDNTSAFFNAGNCYRKLNENGNAIWAYHMALKRNPSDQESAKNIYNCRQSLGLSDTPFLIATQFERALLGVGLTTWMYLSFFLALVVGVLLFFIARKSDFSGRTILRYTLFALLPLLCFSIVSAYKVRDFLDTQIYGIIIHKSAPIFVNDLGERSTESLPEGTMVKIERHTKTKTSATLRNGKRVLLSDSDIRWI